jgi:hypothetical protein
VITVTIKMAFVPPLFSKLGQSAKDLFDKKYEWKNLLQVKNKTKTGLTFTSGADVTNKGIGGLLKLKYKKDTFGEAEADLHTGGVAKATIKAKKLAPGTTVVLTEEAKPKAHPNDPSLKLGVDYQQDFFSGQASAETSFWKYSQLLGAAVIGFDGLSVGGEFKMDANRMSDLEDYNVGAQYEQPDFTATLKTADKGEALTGSAHIKASDDHQIGFSFTKKLDGSDEDSFAVGTEYKLDASNNFKAKADTKGTVAGVFQHRLTNPRLLFGLSSSWDASNPRSVAAKDFGVSFTFGDFEADD